jgi:futalosine hydrolase
VTVIETGVGPVEAAIATSRALAGGRYDAVVNAGIAGVFRGSGRVGDAVLVGEERLAGLGLEDDSALTLPDGARLCDRVSASSELLEGCTRLALPVVRGLTVATVTTSDATAARLVARYEPDVETMEGFAVLRAAQAARVPALEVRGISNYVGDRSKSEWNFSAGRGALLAVLGDVLDCVGVASPSGKSGA